MSVTNSGAGAGIEGINSDATGAITTPGIYGIASGAGVPGVRGENNTAAGFGVFGIAGATGGIGVEGEIDNEPGTGVEGYSQNAGGIGVVASNNFDTGLALSIQTGLFQVTGTGSGSSPSYDTATTAFIHQATAANSSGEHTWFDSPVTNGNANLMVFVTQTYLYGSTYNPHPVGVTTGISTGAAPYQAPSGTLQWGIFNEDQQAMPVGATFFVWVVSQ